MRSDEGTVIVPDTTPGVIFGVAGLEERGRFSGWAKVVPRRAGWRFSGFPRYAPVTTRHGRIIRSRLPPFPEDSR